MLELGEVDSVPPQPELPCSVRPNVVRAWVTGWMSSSWESPDACAEGWLEGHVTEAIALRPLEGGWQEAEIFVPSDSLLTCCAALVVLACCCE